MATLYVENVPDDRYEALRERAKRNGRSISAEIIELLQQSVPTKADLQRRHEFYKTVLEFQKKKPLTPGPHPSAEEMIREIRGD
jgi:Arc-like DNA binding domain